MQSRKYAIRDSEPVLDLLRKSAGFVVVRFHQTIKALLVERLYCLVGHQGLEPRTDRL